LKFAKLFQKIKIKFNISFIQIKNTKVNFFPHPFYDTPTLCSDIASIIVSLKTLKCKIYVYGDVSEYAKIIITEKPT
jgi:hypothetical protein